MSEFKINGIKMVRTSMSDIADVLAIFDVSIGPVELIKCRLVKYYSGGTIDMWGPKMATGRAHGGAKITDRDLRDRIAAKAHELFNAVSGSACKSPVKFGGTPANRKEPA